MQKHIFQIFFFIIFIGNVGISEAQTPPVPITPPPPRNLEYDRPDKIIDFNDVEEQAIFICDTSIQKYIAKNYIYPKAYIKNNIKKHGYIVLNYVVNKEGYIEDIKLLRGIDPLLDQEAIRVIESLGKCYIPAKTAGKPVKVRYQLPLKL